MLFTMGALMMLESQNYMLAALFLFFVFFTPLLDEAMRDEVLKPESGTGRDAAIGEQTGTENGSEENRRELLSYSANGHDGR